METSRKLASLVTRLGAWHMSPRGIETSTGSLTQPSELTAEE
jgi:hypothetical protein